MGDEQRRISDRYLSTGESWHTNCSDTSPTLTASVAPSGRDGDDLWTGTVRGHLPIALALMALTFPTLGQAEDEAETAAQDRAEQLFQEGLAAADAGDFSGAAELFEQSYRLVQHPGMLLDMGLYQQESGRLVEAYASFTELLERFSGVISAETRDLTRSHLADLGHGSNEP